MKDAGKPETWGGGNACKRKRQWQSARSKQQLRAHLHRATGVTRSSEKHDNLVHVTSVYLHPTVTSRMGYDGYTCAFWKWLNTRPAAAWRYHLSLHRRWDCQSTGMDCMQWCLWLKKLRSVWIVSEFEYYNRVIFSLAYCLVSWYLIFFYI